jgi:hypothetical protein
MNLALPSGGRSVFEVAREWLHRLFAPQPPLSVIHAKKPRRGKLDNLYILSTDFPKIADEHREMLEKEFDRLRETYGIDVAVFGPGIHLVPFEDFCDTPAPVTLRAVPLPRVVPRRLVDGEDLSGQGG